MFILIIAHVVRGSYGTSVEAGTISEGFGDYAPPLCNVGVPIPALACIADWDAGSYTSPLRRINLHLRCPEDLTGTDIVMGKFGHGRRGIRGPRFVTSKLIR